MARRRVLILEGDHLPSAGVRSLLSNQNDLHVLAKVFTSFEEMLQIIDDFQPNVIVMDDGMLEKSALGLATSLKDYPSLRTIIVHWEDNEIEVYDRQKVVIRELQDFLSVI